MTFSTYLRTWLKNHPLISAAALEKACGIPATNLMRPDREIPEKYWYFLCYILADYGLKIGEWRLYSDPNGILRHLYTNNPQMTEEYRYHAEESRALDGPVMFIRFLHSHFGTEKAAS